MNWFGKKAKGIGYTEITIFIQKEDNPAFNFIYRVLFPSVFLILISSSIKSINNERYIYDIYLVTIYSFLIRIIYNILSGRALLVDWRKVLLYSISSILLSYFVNIKIINKINFLPDFNTMTNELWILIFIFIYHIFNKTNFFKNNEEQRKLRYIKKSYCKYIKEFGSIINEIVDNNKLKLIIYSIIIHESFNRYKIGRILIENNLYRIGRAKTLGIMQVNTDVLINDKQSIYIGVDKIVRFYKEKINETRIKGENIYEDSLSWEIIFNYNRDTHYVEAINYIMYMIEEKICKTNFGNLVPLDIEKSLKKDVKKDVKKDEKK
ncbi:MAG: hypothetical protein NTU73_14240 [Ignavibacteriae bacterium]|nr:hypothetical protein [Ignavibacteriota bacterium]